jgi:hypothetical protein
MVAHPKIGAKITRDLRTLFVKYVPTAGSPRFPKGAVAVTDNTYNRVRFLCKVVLGRMNLKSASPSHALRIRDQCLTACRREGRHTPRFTITEMV